MKEKFKNFLDSDHRPRLLVIGDLILDEYIWGAVSRISPEAPVPILETKSENLTLGGAANVANNLVALGCEVHLVGAIGQDEKGDKLLTLIEEKGISSKGIFRFVHRPTTSKIRVVAHNQQLLKTERRRPSSLIPYAPSVELPSRKLSERRLQSFPPRHPRVVRPKSSS